MQLTGFSRGGLTFDVRDGGPRDGEPVVLLHGFPQDATCWGRVVPRLHDAGLRTLAPDQRGYSRGARPAGRSAYRIDALVGDVLVLLDQAGLGPAHLVGHDWGGGVAWAAAGRHPERVRTLTVVSTPHPAALIRSLPRSGQAARSWYMALFQLPWLPERLAGGGLARMLRSGGLDEGQAQRYAARMAEPGALTGALGWYRAIPWSVRDPAGITRVPTTYVWGRRDPVLGRVAAELTGRFVRAPYRFVEVDGGHWLPETRPEEVAGAIIARTGPDRD